MENRIMTMPANYTVVDGEEMMYLDGGGQIADVVGAVTSSIVSGTVTFFQVIGDSLKSCARSFVEITMDDLSNPNFWGAVALTGALAAIGFGMAYSESKKAEKKAA